MEGTEQNRTEQPTSYKLRQARRKGAVARGMDLGFLAVLIAFISYGWIGGPAAQGAIAKAAHDVLVAGPRLADGNAALLELVSLLFWVAITPILFLAGIVFAIVLLLEILQTGFVFSAHPLKPDFGRLNPAKGLKRLFSVRLLIETLKNVLKLIVYTIIGWLVVHAAISIDGGTLSDAGRLAAAMSRMMFRLLGGFLLAAIVIAILDQLIARRDFLKRMRMSRREVRREHREREGDPRFKQKRKQLHAEFVKVSKSLRGLKGSDVLVTNPQHIAIALRYDHKTMLAPKVVSIGTNHLARRLKRLAFIYSIPVVEDRILARALHRSCVIDAQIPEHCFKSVADIYNTLRRQAGPEGQK